MGKNLLETALKAYKGSEEGTFDKEKLREYVDYVLKKYQFYSGRWISDRENWIFMITVYHGGYKPFREYEEVV